MINTLLATNQIVTYVILGVLVVAIIAMFFFSSSRRKKQEKDAQDLINAVKPGNKVKTIGGICGIVVEVNEEENTFVLETGTEQSGKCFVKFDKQAIYQTDAVVAKTETNTEEKPSEEKPAEETVEEKSEAVEEVAAEPAAPVAAEESVPVEEPAEAEEKPAKAKSKSSKKQ